MGGNNVPDVGLGDFCGIKVKINLRLVVKNLRVSGHIGV